MPLPAGQGRRPPAARLLPGADDLGLLRSLVPAPVTREARRRAASGRLLLGADRRPARRVARAADPGRRAERWRRNAGARREVPPPPPGSQASFPGRSFVAPRRLARALPNTRPSPHAVRSGLSTSTRPTRVGRGEVYAGVPLLGAGAEPAALYRAIQVGPNVASVGPGSAASLNGVAKGEVRLVHAARGRAEPPWRSRRRASSSPSGAARHAHCAFQESRRRFEPSWARGASS